MSYTGFASYNTATANTDVVVTLTGVSASVAPQPSARHMIKQINWSLTADPAAAVTINVKNGTTNAVLTSFDITKGGPGFMLFGDKGFPCTLGENTVITLDLASDSGVTGKITVLYDFA